MTGIESVGIVGSGTMGRGIAHAVAAAPGLRVVLLDTAPASLESALAQLAGEYDRLESKGAITAHERARRDQSLITTTNREDMADCDLIIEAVPEVLSLKLSVLADLTTVARRDAIIASNTSSIPITRLSTVVVDPRRFIGIHFFNPVPRMPLVEVIRTVHSDQTVEDSVISFIRGALGKEPIAVDDRPGFVVNALLVRFLLTAARMLDSGYATAEQIDTGMKLGAAHPMGPLALSDLIGLDVVCDVGDSIYAETRDPAVIVPNNLRRLVEAGKLGLKSGTGFFTY